MYWKGRLGTRLWLNVGVPVFISLLLAFYLITTLGEERRATAEAAKISELKSQNRLLIENSWNTIDLLRLKALSLKNATQPLALKNSGILYLATLTLNSVSHSVGKPIVKSSLGSLQWKGLVHAELYLESILKQFKVQNLREQGISLLRIKQDPMSRSEWLAFIFINSNVKPVLNDSAKDEALLVLVNPQEVFQGFSRFAAMSGSSASRAYLLTSDGIVLAHTSSAYVGASFAELPGFLEVAHSAKREGSERGDLRLTSVDQNKVALSYSRLGTLPLVVVTERVLESSGLSNRFWNEGNLKVFGVLFLLVSVFLFALRSSLNLLLRKKRPLPISKPIFEAVRKMEPHLTPIEPEPLASLEHSLSKFLETQALLEDERKNHALLSRFEIESLQMRDPIYMTKKLVEVSAALCKSPVLFFAYRHEISAAILQSYAGFLEGEVPSPMSFVIKANLLSQLQKQVEEEAILTVSDYEPLAHILLAKTGVAHFDAWAMTGFGPLGRQSEKQRLLGILVILRSGTDVVLHHDALQRLLRSSGMIYENILLSQ